MAGIICLSLNPALDLSVRLARLAPGEVNRADASHMAPAGKGNNVARVLAALGHAVTVSGFLGEGNAGVFERAFTDWGVEDAFVRVPGDTRINIKLAENDGRVSDINAAGAPVDGQHWQQLLSTLDGLFERSPAAVVIAGSLPPGVSPSQLGELIERGRRANVTVWLDSSGEALSAGLSARPVAAKPNERELAQWAGRHLDSEADYLEAAQRLVSEGIDDLFVSLGSDGVLWCRGDGVLCARPPRVEVVSTVCAGDSLVAGLLHGRLSGWPNEQTLRFATALSADAVRRLGVGEPIAEDFEALCQQVQIESISCTNLTLRSGPLQ